MLLNKENSLVLIIDVQEKLVAALDKDIVVNKTSILANAAKLLNIPIIVTQQYSKGLGETDIRVRQNFTQETQVFEKTAFSVLKEPGFLDLLKSYNKKQIVICGIETHICVYQTAVSLIKEGFEVYVAKDACASRKKYEFKTGIDLMQQNGAKISCLETILFEWIEDAKSPYFKDLQQLIKG